MPRSLPLAAALDRHRAALASCTRCPRLPGVRPVLSLARAPRIMLVGQAPGRAEAENARPFTGRAGRTLFRWLDRAGIGEETFREHVYIAAITRCYPGPHPAGRGDRVPSPAERTTCSSWLDAELALIRPALIIPVGRLAIDRFLGGASLDALIGAVHQVTHGGGHSTAIPLPHPSGASSWLNSAEHQALLASAIDELGVRFAALGLTRETVRRPLRSVA